MLWLHLARAPFLLAPRAFFHPFFPPTTALRGASTYIRRGGWTVGQHSQQTQLAWVRPWLHLGGPNLRATGNWGSFADSIDRDHQQLKYESCVW